MCGGRTDVMCRGMIRYRLTTRTQKCSDWVLNGRTEERKKRKDQMQRMEE